MALTHNEVVKRLRNAGDTLKFGKQRVPHGSDSKLDVSCGCSADHEMGEALLDIALWGRPTKHTNFQKSINALINIVTLRMAAAHHRALMRFFLSRVIVRTAACMAIRSCQYSDHALSRRCSLQYTKSL
eukprot:6163176-Pleurochrysis_carterae.AAC.1